MRILWIKSDLLHPTTRGGQIRTLELLRRLSQRHDVTYVAYEELSEPDARARSGEYCARCYTVPHTLSPRRSLAFATELARGLVSPVPVSIRRYQSKALRSLVASLLGREHFDRIVCDFLQPAYALPDLSKVILFQHNVESRLCERHAEFASDPVTRLYLRRQAIHMRATEGRICRAVGHIIAVSAEDAAEMRARFGVTAVSAIPTGVDIDYFARPADPAPVADLVFVGAMDWLPNILGVRYFVRRVLPLIRRRRPHCTLAIVGRKPPSDIVALARQDSSILVTGTVPDVRPYLWGASVSIVPLDIGGGTRLKIYESMAAGTAVVSTSVGAEGLDIDPAENICIADAADVFAEQCLNLLEDPAARTRTAAAALRLVSSRCTWDSVAERFNEILEQVSHTALSGSATGTPGSGRSADRATGNPDSRRAVVPAAETH
jgi:glycosyltransferase involved in cell wall biosynthesis